MLKNLIVLSLVLVVCIYQSVFAEETSADVITHISHNPSQHFVKGRELMRARKYTEAMITLKKAVADGDAWAAAMIGSIYADGGDGIEPDIKNAINGITKQRKWAIRLQTRFLLGVTFMVMVFLRMMKKHISWYISSRINL